MQKNTGAPIKMPCKSNEINVGNKYYLMEGPPGEKKKKRVQIYICTYLKDSVKYFSFAV